MNNVLVILAAILAILFWILERDEQEEKEVEEENRIKKERYDRLTHDVRAFARKHKQIDFSIG